MLHYNLPGPRREGNDSAAAFYKKMGLTPQFTCLEEVLPKQSLI